MNIFFKKLFNIFNKTLYYTIKTITIVFAIALTLLLQKDEEICAYRVKKEFINLFSTRVECCMDKLKRCNGLVNRYILDTNILFNQRNEVQNKVDGIETQFHRDGKTVWWIANYQMGKKEGLQTYYREDGTLFYVQNFKNNILHGFVEEYFTDGITLWWKMEYSNGKPINKAYIYRENGSLEYMASFHKHTPQGDFVAYHKDGKSPDWTVRYENGKKEGLEKHYHPDGTLERVMEFQEDILKKITIYNKESNNIKRNVK